jgi:SAM-dependent methyltransferase
VRIDDRARSRSVLAPVQRLAHEPGEYVGQESFMRASEIRELAVRAGIGPGVSVLDLCCGVGGSGRHLAQRFFPRYVGVDASAEAVELARDATRGLDCELVVGVVPPLPVGRFDVVLLLETFLAFADKETLVRGIAGALRPGGRFAFTLEAGPPLSQEERAAMPRSETVWPTPLETVVRCLERHGLRTVWHADRTEQHLAVAAALTRRYEEHSEAIAGELGQVALDELVTSHRLWVAWLRSRRIRKVAVVAEKVG